MPFRVCTFAGAQQCSSMRRNAAGVNGQLLLSRLPQRIPVIHALRLENICHTWREGAHVLKHARTLGSIIFAFLLFFFFPHQSRVSMASCPFPPLCFSRSFSTSPPWISTKAACAGTTTLRFGMDTGGKHRCWVRPEWTPTCFSAANNHQLLCVCSCLMI